MCRIVAPNCLPADALLPDLDQAETDRAVLFGEERTRGIEQRQDDHRVLCSRNIRQLARLYECIDPLIQALRSDVCRPVLPATSLTRLLCFGLRVRGGWTVAFTHRFLLVTKKVHSRLFCLQF